MLKLKTLYPDVRTVPQLFYGNKRIGSFDESVTFFKNLDITYTVV